MMDYMNATLMNMEMDLDVEGELLPGDDIE